MGSEERSEFAALYEEHSPYVRALARRLLRDSSDAEDVVHEVFLQAWRQIDSFDSARGEMRGWLTIMTRSRALDQLRRRTRRERLVRLSTALSAPTSDDACRTAERAQSTARVRRAWESLPPITREVLELAYAENLPQREIAVRLNETLGVVKSRIRQGLLALRTHAMTRMAAADEPDEPERALTTTEFSPGTTRSLVLPVLRNVRVVIVDDDAPTRQVLKLLLTRAGASPLLCASAADACRTLRDFWPDVLVADINMPGEDGFALMKRVLTIASRREKYLPAIAFTARATESDRSRVLNAGFQLYLSKPVHPIAVLTAIKRVASPPPPGT